MFTRAVKVGTTLLVVALFLLGVFAASNADAQTVTYPVYWSAWYPSTVHYHRYWQGTQWHWTPQYGWHQHDYYVEVPCWTPTYYVYPAATQPWVVCWR
jgi:hypothetical protein